VDKLEHALRACAGAVQTTSIQQHVKIVSNNRCVDVTITVIIAILTHFATYKTGYVEEWLML